MTHTSRRPTPSVRGALVAAAVLALAALTAPLAAGADQPALPIGGLPGITGPGTTTASVSPGGQGNACAAGQTAAVDPTASALTDAVQIGAGGCSGGGSAGTSSTSTSTGGTSDTGSTGGRQTTATASASATTKASVLEASAASELEITTVRFTTKNVRSARKLGVVVTVRGQQSSPVRNGTVAINDLPTAKIDCLCQRATFTNNAGQAAFTIPVTKSMLGKRLFLQVSARTPTLRSTKLVSVQIP